MTPKEEGGTSFKKPNHLENISTTGSQICPKLRKTTAAEGILLAVWPPALYTPSLTLYFLG